MDNAGNIFLFLIVAVAAIIIVYFIREVICWYFKLTKIVELLERIEKNTSDKTYIVNKSNS